MKVAKAAISGVVPVVGGIISDASETVLAGAGMLKNTIGVFGTLAILAACAYPFLQLGVQYLLYKLTAFLAGRGGGAGTVQADRRPGRRLRADPGHDRQLRAAAAGVRAVLRGGGDAMIEAVREWLLAVVGGGAAAVGGPDPAAGGKHPAGGLLHRRASFCWRRCCGRCWGRI